MHCWGEGMSEAWLAVFGSPVKAGSVSVEVLAQSDPNWRVGRTLQHSALSARQELVSSFVSASGGIRRSKVLPSCAVPPAAWLSWQTATNGYLFTSSGGDWVLRY